VAKRREVEADLSELHALVADNEGAAGSVRQLEGTVGHLVDGWMATMGAVESQLPGLLGDAAITAAAIVYAGPLPPSQRAAAVAAWHQTAVGLKLPVSEQFELGGFLAARARTLLAAVPAQLRAVAEHARRSDVMVMAALAPRPPLLFDPMREVRGGARCDAPSSP
jgi:hypothetical protein